MTTAVNAVVQVEPFKFFHNMNDSIRNYQEPASSLQHSQTQVSNVGNHPDRSSKPAGIAHLGFTCFWPNGGGLEEENTFRKSHQPHQQQDTWASEDEDDDTEEFDDWALFNTSVLGYLAQEAWGYGTSMSPVIAQKVLVPTSWRYGRISPLF